MRIFWIVLLVVVILAGGIFGWFSVKNAPIRDFGKNVKSTLQPIFDLSGKTGDDRISYWKNLGGQVTKINNSLPNISIPSGQENVAELAKTVIIQADEGVKEAKFYSFLGNVNTAIQIKATDDKVTLQNEINSAITKLESLTKASVEEMGVTSPANNSKTEQIKKTLENFLENLKKSVQDITLGKVVSAISYTALSEEISNLQIDINKSLDEKVLKINDLQNKLNKDINKIF